VIPAVDEHSLKGSLRDLIRTLAAIPGLAGHEQEIGSEVRRRLRDLVDEVSVDRLGNVYGIRRGRGQGPTLMLAAHTDEIGFMVRSVDANGFLRFEKVGRPAEQALLGQRVLIEGRCLGVIGVRPGHLSGEAERRLPPVADMYIDVGAVSAADVAAMGIRVGSPVTFAGEVTATVNPDRLVGRALDNRLGVAVMLLSLASLTGPPPGDVVAVATVQEELGLRGAAVAAFRTRPDYALALDTVPVGDTPDVDLTRELRLSLGRGPAAILASSREHVGMMTHPAVRRHLLTAAGRAGVSVQEVIVLGQLNTDATAITLSREGIPAGTVSLPRRYAHTPVEMCDLNDAVGAIRLTTQFMTDMAEHSLDFFEDR